MNDPIRLEPGTDAELRLWRTAAEVAALDPISSPPRPARRSRRWGGAQALARRRLVTVEVAGESFSLPVPTLLGALIIKARVSATSSNPKHRRDLARLLALVGDIEAVRTERRRGEWKYLRLRSELRDPGHTAWNGISDAEDAIIALERLAEPSYEGWR